MLLQLHLDSLENTCHNCNMDVRFLDVVVRNLLASRCDVLRGIGKIENISIVIHANIMNERKPKQKTDILVTKCEETVSVERR